MIAFAHSAPIGQHPKPAWHAPFLAILPRVQAHLGFAFRKMRPDDRGEAVGECIAHVAVAFAALHSRGKANAAFATTLCDYAIRHFYAGRRVGSSLNADDVSSPWAQKRRGFRVRSLDRRDPAGGWKEIVVEDGRATPADVAASRIDLGDWLDQLSRLKRGVAETLAASETTCETARQFSVTPGRVSQIRRELEKNWAEFQGEALVCA